MTQRPRKPKKDYQHLQPAQNNHRQLFNDYQEDDCTSLEQLLALNDAELASKVRAGLEYLLHEQRNPSIQAKRFFSLSHYLARNDEYTVFLQFKKQPKIDNQEPEL